MILAELNKYYLHLAEQSKANPQGYSKEKISYAITLAKRGKVIAIDDLREGDKKPKAKLLDVPQLPKRANTIAPAFMWDNSSYVLGVSGDEKKQKRVTKLHKAFKEYMLTAINDSMDEGLVALKKFLKNWSPEMFGESPFDSNKEILDTNVVFRLDGKRQYLHERNASKKLWLQLQNNKEAIDETGCCLISCENTSIARVHPPIKGVRGSSTMGANIVSFNLDAFISYGKKQSYNAPISKRVADQYVKALNYLLRKNSLIIGDATVVYWAKAKDNQKADQAEGFLGSILNPRSSDDQETGELQKFLDIISKGRPLQEYKDDLDENTRIFVLGLSPNVSRLSIRFWQAGTLKFFVKRIARHYRDLRLKPLPWKTPPSVWRLLLETTPSRDGKRKADDVLPHLAGETMRAICTDPYRMRTLVLLLTSTLGGSSEYFRY